VFFPYIAINKTPLDLKLMSTLLNKTLKPFSSVLIRPIASKMQIKVDNYEPSKYFEINTYGVSGVVELKRRNGKTPGQGSLIDPAVDPES
jgi:hypothetical protein